MPTINPRRWLVLLAVMLAFLPVVIDMTILHIAVPSLTLALGASGTEILWIIDIYPLMMAGLLVPMGTLADRVGLSQSATSQHLKLLRRDSLVATRRQGTIIHYRIADSRVARMINALHGLFCAA